MAWRACMAMAAATDTGNLQPAGPKKTLHQYFQVAERSTEGVGESSSSKPKSAVVMHVGKLPKISQKPPRKVGRPRKKLETSNYATKAHLEIARHDPR